MIRPPWAPTRSGSLDLVVDRARPLGRRAPHHSTVPRADARGRADGPFADVGGPECWRSPPPSCFAPVVAVDNELAALAYPGELAGHGVALHRLERHTCGPRPRPWHGPSWRTWAPLALRVAELSTEPPETLILSRMLEDEVDEVARGFAPLRERGRRSLEVWSAGFSAARLAAMRIVDLSAPIERARPTRRSPSAPTSNSPTTPPGRRRSSRCSACPAPAA